MDDSDSDDFFDARQDITSPRCPSSPILVSVDDAFENNLQSSNPNSPSRLGGDLSLAHLLQENASNVSVVTVENDKSPADNEPFQHHTSVQEKPGTDELGEDCGVDKQRGDDQKLETISQTSSSKPDLVACIQERPIDLPGVQPVMVESIDVSQPKKSTYQPPPKTHLSLPRPNRPPPPRPKEPPKRPPPPKSAPPAKLTFGHGDDNLLTPNTTVDNITKEFADALKDDLQRTKSTSSSSQNDTTQPKPRKNFMSSLTKRYSSKDSLTSEKHSKNIAAVTSTSLQLSPEKPPSPTFSPTVPAPSEPQPPAQPGPSNLEETRTWSELSKSSVLRIDSTPPLEILSTVIVRNLDTGQTMPLSVAAEQVSQCLNPLALQIMSRTKEFSYPGGPQEDPPTPTTSAPPDPSQQLFRSDEETLSVASDDITIGGDAVPGSKPAEGSSGSGGGGKLRVKSKRFKRILGKGARKVKAAAETKVERAVLRVKQAKHDGSRSDSLNVSSDEEASDSLASSSVKTKASSSHKGPHQFGHLKLVQDIAVHVGAVWSMKFSHCGRLLATAGQNNIIWVWVLKEWYPFFNDMRRKYDSKERGAVFATPPRGSMEPPSSFDDEDSHPDVDQQMEEDPDAPFKSLPFSSYYGHTADVLDLAWSKNYFTLSSSMDKTVRLWHVSQKECLCCFQHIDFVTAISFHPKDDRYFLSGSLDGKLRLWNIPDKKVALWNEVSPDSSSNAGSGGSGALITTVNFCEGGKFAVCGTYDGRCLFYDTEHLKYHTQIHVRSSRGRNQKGRKITGIEPLPNEHKILVTSNDSRVRLYDLRDLSLTCKYKGLTNLSSQIKASFSQDNNFIICGSEDKSIYIWRTHLPPDVTKLSSFRRDRNDAWECIRAHNAVVTCAIFAPKPQKRNEPGSNFGKLRKSSLLASDNYVIISADFNGVIKIFAPT